MWVHVWGVKEIIIFRFSGPPGVAPGASAPQFSFNYPTESNSRLLMRAQLSNFYFSIISAKEYIDEKMASLAKKAVRDESLDDGTFVAFLMLEDKLSREEIYGVVAEIMTGSVDTVSSSPYN